MTNADVDAFVARLATIAAHRWDGADESTRTRVTSAQTVLSVGSSQTAANVNYLLDQIQPLIDCGNVTWSNLDDTAEAYATQDAGGAPSGSTTLSPTLSPTSGGSTKAPSTLTQSPTSPPSSAQSQSSRASMTPMPYFALNIIVALAAVMGFA